MWKSYRIPLESNIKSCIKVQLFLLVTFYLLVYVIDWLCCLIIRASLEPALNTFLSRCGSSLISLHISECSLVLTERCLWLASIHCPNLAYCHYSSEEFPATPESVWALACGCICLKVHQTSVHLQIHFDALFLKCP